jgi:hypothetical protein
MHCSLSLRETTARMQERLPRAGERAKESRKRLFAVNP